MTKTATALLGLTCILLAGATAPAQESPLVDDSLPAGLSMPPFQPAPAGDVVAKDREYDNGEAIEISWRKSVDDPQGVIGYTVYRAPEGGEFEKVGLVPPGVGEYLDEGVQRNIRYRYKIGLLWEGGEFFSEVSRPAAADAEFFNFDMWNLFLLAIIICGSVILFIYKAKAGHRLFIRKIGGLEALDEAVGRATEMGRPILFIPGILDMDDVQTLAAITILSRVSGMVAEYDSKIRMPVSRSLVMTTARETIRESYLTAGRPDAYSDDMVQYVTDEQFGYVAAVNGIMVREKPATCLYLGAFFAESLILAETGNSIGAIQIAGTARPGQLPFFVAACDYTLIGEELFAASAYLSEDPKQLGSLKGQDVGKTVAMLAIVIGTIAMTLSAAWNIPAMDWVLRVMNRIFSTFGG